MKKRNALGRGLNALLNDASTVLDSSQQNQGEQPPISNQFFDIPIEYISENPYQPRIEFEKEALQELAESIRLQGIIQPITVRKLRTNKYQLISGERRLQAAQLIGMTTMPAYIREVSDQQMLELALIENIQRENLNAIEIAMSYQRLIDECHLKQEELGERVGKNRSTVTNYLRLLKLPTEVQQGLMHKKITMGHARALAGIENRDLLLEVFLKTVREDLSVRKVENLVRDLGNSPKKEEKKEKNQNPKVQVLQNKLSSHFGTTVSVHKDDKDKGSIKIPFASIEDLNRLIEIFKLDDH